MSPAPKASPATSPGGTAANGSGCIPAVAVVEESAVQEISISAPADLTGETLRLTVRCEDGRTAGTDSRLWDLPQTATTQMDGRTWIRRRARLPQPDGPLPLGYHEVTAAAGGVEAACRYIVTPARVYTPEHLGRGGRAAGIAVSLYGLRSARNWGCGDFTDLLRGRRLGRRRAARRLHRPQPAPRHPQPPPLQHQPLSAQLRLLPELPLPRRGSGGGFLPLAPRPPGLCGARRGR